MITISIALLFFVANQVHGHTYHTGECAVVQPIQNFDIQRFLGKWYVIQKTSTASDCLVDYYYENPEEPGNYKIEQISENYILALTTSDRQYHYMGDLILPEGGTSSDMEVKFFFNVAGSASYTVFATDYETYAGIFTCQKIGFFHRRSSAILSRTRTLSNEIVQLIRQQLSDYGVDPYELSIIKQSNCTESKKRGEGEGVTSLIKKAGKKIGDGLGVVTDSAKKAGKKIGEGLGVVSDTAKKAGKKIGESFGAVSDSAKKAFAKIKGRNEDTEEPTGEEREDRSEDRSKNMKEDAEWLV